MFMKDGLYLSGKGASVFVDVFNNIFCNKHCLN